MLLAPYFGDVHATSDLTYMSNIAGALDLYPLPLFGMTVSASPFATVNLFVQLVIRDEMLRAARESTQVLRIFASMIQQSIFHVQGRCATRNSVAVRLHIPKNLGLNHFITPELGNKLSLSSSTEQQVKVPC